MSVPVGSGLVLHLESDAGVAIVDGVVTGWIDGSASSNHLVSRGDPQVIQGATPSGAAAIDFDGAGDLLERTAGLSGLVAGNGDRTMYFVARYLDAEGVAAGLVYGDGASNQAFGLATNSKDNDLMLQGWGSKNDFDSNLDGPDSGWMVHSVVYSGGSWSHYRDGVLIGSGTHAFSTDVQKLVIGGEIAGLGEAKMQVASALIYDRALSAAEQAQVNQYLYTKYIEDGIDDPPSANDDATIVLNGGTVAVDVLANDSDDTGLDPASINIVTAPQYGTIGGIDLATGKVTYVHDGSGRDDSFSYTVADAAGNVSAPASVALTVGVPPLSLDGFTDESVLKKAGFQPISMAFLPDNRMLLVSKGGEILIVDPESGASSSYMKLNNIDAGQERGLLDITLDADFAENGYFYLYYTPNNPKQATISRFQHQENSGGLTSTASVTSENVIWQDTDGYLACCHYGGGLDFGPDGKIWLTTADKFQATTPGEGAAGGVDLMLDLASSSGKIIRVNPDGSVPDGSDGWAANPWANPHDGFNDYVWAYGLRNPFRARWDLEYGQMYIGEVGGNQQLIAHDDLHVTDLNSAGAFYGWPFYEGTPNTYVNAGQSSANPANFPAPDGDLANATAGDFYSAPIWSLPHNGKTASLTGGEVYRGDMFPDEWQGVYFYGDYTRDYIRYMLLDSTGTQVLGDFAFKPSAAIAGTTNEVVSITVGADGALYYAMIASGEVRRVTFDNNAAPVITAATVTPLTGDLPLTVTFEATVTDVDGDAMTYTVNFGDGTVISGVVGPDGLISVEHLYEVDGRYAVSLTLADPTHSVFSQSFKVDAGDVNFAPEITGAASDVELAGAGVTEVTFTAQATDPDNDTLTYVWHFGDGTTAQGTVDASGQVTATHIYQTEGSYEAYLQVSDGQLSTVSPNLPVQVGDAAEVPVTNGLVLLLQSDIKIGLAQGNTVAAWLDGSGQGNNLFAQGDPQLVANQTPTGENAIVFDGAGDLLQRVNATDTIFNLPGGSADRTIFIVVDHVNPEGVSAGVVYGDSANNETFGLVADRNGTLSVQGWGRGNDFPSGVNGVTGGFMVQSVVLSGNRTYHYKDGTLIDSDAKTFNTDVKKLVLGGEIAGLGESQMKIAAVLIYDRALNTTERQQVEAFLQEKYIVGSSDNTPPIASNDQFVFVEDTPLQGSVLVNDTDPDGDSLSVALVAGAGPQHGTLSLGSDGSFIYTPGANFDGVDQFVYRLSDGRGGQSDAIVTLTGTPADDPATAVADSYATMPGTLLTVSAAEGVLANDFDPEGDFFSATLVAGPDNGTLTLNPNGSFDYQPYAGFQGQDSFTYQVTGGSVATVVIGVEDGPSGPVTAGLVAAYQAGENVSTGIGNVVTGWLDGSGRGNDLVARGDPTLVQGATPTGQAAIVFDGAGDLLQRVNATDTLNGLMGGAADRTMFFVVDYVNPEGVSAGVVYGDGASNETFGLVADKNGTLSVQGWGRGNDFPSGVNGVTGGFMVQSVVLSGNRTNHYKDGTLIDSDAKTFNTDLKKLVIGGEIAGLGEAAMQVAAVLIYDRALDTTERASVESYLQQLYIDDSFAFV